MKSGSTLSMLAALFLMSGCLNKPIDNTHRLENTHLVFTLPSGWVKSENGTLDKALKASADDEALQQDLEGVKEALDTFEQAIYLKPIKVNGKNRNLSLLTLTLPLGGEKVDLDLSFQEVLAGVRTTSALESLEFGQCPALKVAQYRCATVNLKHQGRNIRQLQYALIDNDTFVQLVFSSSSTTHDLEIDVIAESFRESKD